MKGAGVEPTLQAVSVLGLSRLAWPSRPMRVQVALTCLIKAALSSLRRLNIHTRKLFEIQTVGSLCILRKPQGRENTGVRESLVLTPMTAAGGASGGRAQVLKVSSWRVK